MTRRTPADDGVVEMDAMDVREWEAGQRTPQASDANLAALVKQSAHASGPVVADRPSASIVFVRPAKFDRTGNADLAVVKGVGVNSGLPSGGNSSSILRVIV